MQAGKGLTIAISVIDGDLLTHYGEAEAGKLSLRRAMDEEKLKGGKGKRKSRFNPFLPTVPTFAVRETDVSRHNWGTSGAPLKPLRDDRL